MKKFSYLLMTSLFLLTGCNQKISSSSKIENLLVEGKVNINSSKEGKVYTPNEIEISETLHSLENKRFYNTRVLPSIGDVNILVVPILLPDYQTIDLNNDGKSDNDKVKEDLTKAFFGSSEETKFESVSSYYYKSSFGKLNLQGEVTDFFDLSKTDLGYTHAVEIDTYETYEVASEAIKFCKNILGMDLTKYDNDKDGYIDGLWLIYSAPNYQNGGPRTDNGNYWAYTAWGNQGSESSEEPSLSSPIYNLFGWASYDFMYEGYGINEIDSHTYIHETGHFLGLNDYYSDNLSYAPLGRVDMMDSNIADHNSYSKMLLGWSKPYVVSGSASIDLKSIANENNFIVVLDDETELKDNKFDPFSEYLLIELYSNEGLNNFDSINRLEGRVSASTSIGYRLFHIDNRKFYVDTYDLYDLKIKEYEGELIDNYHKLVLPITNARGYNIYNYAFGLDPIYNLFDEIRMIEKTNEDTFSSGGYQKEKSFFTNGDSFSLAKYGKNFFFNGDSFNNGHKFESVINFEIKGGNN